MLESPTSAEVHAMAKKLLNAFPVEMAPEERRLNAVESAGFWVGDDYLAVDLLGSGGYRLVRYEAQGSSEERRYRVTTLLWHCPDASPKARGCTLVDNFGNAGAVLAHFMQAAG